MVALNFNARNVKPNIALEAVPSGIYPVMITKSEEKPTKAGTGSYIELEMTVMQGHEFAGRKVFDRLNTNNANAQTVEIAYSTLSAICHVCQVFDLQDTQQLHGRPFQAVVVKQPRDDRPDLMTNNVRGYKDMQGNDPGTAGQAAQPAAQPGWAGNGQTQQPPQGQVSQQPVQQQQPPAQQPVQLAPVQQQQPAPAQQPQQAQPQTDPNAQPAWAQGGANAAAAPATPAWAQ